MFTQFLDHEKKYGHMVLPSSEQRFFLMLKFAPGEGFDL